MSVGLLSASADRFRESLARLSLAIAAATLLAASCSDGEPHGIDLGSVPQLRQITSIGCAACDFPQPITVRALATNGTERIYVLARYPPFVRVFDTVGRQLAEFAPAGEGPGEMSRPARIFARDDGSVLVLDRVSQRLLLFTEQGALRNEFDLDRFPTAIDYLAGSDTFYFTSYDRGDSVAASAVFAWRPGEERPRLLRRMEAEYPLDEDGGPARFFPIAVGPRGTLAVGEHADAYRVRLYDMTGTLQAEVGLGRERRRKSDEETLASRAEASRSSIRLEVDPRKLHYYSGALAFDGRSRLWVRAGRSTNETTLFDVFAQTGYIGTVQIGGEIVERGNSFTVTGQLLVGVFLGPAGNHEVRVFRIEERSTP